MSIDTLTVANTFNQWLAATNAAIGVLNTFSNTQTSVNGSTSGNATFCQVQTGTADKKVMIYCSALVGTASYTFPTPFSHVPAVLITNGPANTVVTALSNSAVTVTGSTTTGFVILEGF